MHISHIAIWTENLEEMKDFYVKYFNGKSNNKYTNEAKGFESYFISFPSGPSLELMRKTGLNAGICGDYLGYTHIAFKLDSEDEVDRMTAKLKAAGVPVAGEPRRTGDGFYESVILDTDGNKIELVA